MNTITAPRNGGHDPDNMNAARAGWGLLLVAKIRSLTGTDQEDAVSDAIGDLLHAACAMGQDPAAQLERAVNHFNAETSEEG